jgi:hypothetical protein
MFCVEAADAYNQLLQKAYHWVGLCRVDQRG